MAKRKQAPEPPPPTASEILDAFAAGGATLPECATLLMAVVDRLVQSVWCTVKWHDCRDAVWEVANRLGRRSCAPFFEATRWQQYALIYHALCRTERAHAQAWLFRRGAEKRAVAERHRPLLWPTNALDSLCLDGRSTPIVAGVMCGVYPFHLQHMVECGATVDGIDADGQTALHRAIVFRFEPKEDVYSTLTVEFLIEKGAPLDVRNAQGLTPLDLAIRRGRSRLFKPLVLAGAKATSEKRLASVRRAADRQGWRDETAAIEAAWSEVAFRVGFPPAKEWRKSEGGRF